MEITYFEFATALAKEAGAMIKAGFGLNTKVELKEDKSPLTVTDTAINTFVIESVKKTFPTHSILGEEGSFTVQGSTFTWVCDPIDGTMPFSLGIPISTFSLALVENGIPILGVIYDPFTDRLYTAEKGKGCFLNGEQVHVSTRSDLSTAFISNDSRKFFDINMPLLSLGARVMKFYCCTCPGALLTCGQFDVVLFGGTSAWDIAALKILIEEAGGKVTDRFGDEQRYDQPLNGAILSNGLFHDQILTLFDEYGLGRIPTTD